MFQLSTYHVWPDPNSTISTNPIVILFIEPKTQQSCHRRSTKKTPANAQASEDVDDVDDEDFSASSALESSESEVEAITNEEVQLFF